MQTMVLEVAAETQSNALMQFLPLILIVVVFYLILIRPQKKREKEVQAMRSNLEVGDEIVTIGGILGTVVLIKDDYIVLETGSDRSKIRIVRAAVQSNNTKMEAAQAAAAEARNQKSKAKGQAKEEKAALAEPETESGGPDIK